jgi:hypothetical protein
VGGTKPLRVGPTLARVDLRAVPPATVRNPHLRLETAGKTA